MKKLLILGGSSYVVPVIETAHKLGCYVITCDYLPDNAAHKYSDEYINISVTDQEAVLKYAKEKEIDGIISFACDAGVVTAAYTAEKMCLPFQCSYQSACILQDKGLFRKFLTDNHFNCPKSKRYTDAEEPYNDIAYFNWPVIVKPVDSAGSKGVSKVDSPNKLKEAITKALEYTRSEAFIIEDFLTFTGYHSSADLFTINGKLQFVTYSDQLFDQKAENAYTPSLIIWPTTMKQSHQDYLTKEIQRLMTLLGMKNGIYNIETCVGIDGKPYIMEVSPRGGGCKIAEIQEMAMGVRLIENEIRSALNMPLLEMTSHKANGHWGEVVVHAQNNQIGKLKKIDISAEVEEKYIKLKAFTVKPGDEIKPFTGGNASIGDIFLKCDSREELDELLRDSCNWLHICCLNHEG